MTCIDFNLQKNIPQEAFPEGCSFYSYEVS
jgi:hypothetical protein